ncbi:MAG: hypothetical protein K2L79_01645 [Bacteroidales bacterium]|nr:hypothetical protein [Bacteroidales bacterium]
MYNFRMLNRRPLELPPLDLPVPMVNHIEYKNYSVAEVQNILKRLPKLLYNKYSNWYFFLSQKAIGKLRYETYPVHNAEILTLHLSAVANIGALILNAVLGYSKTEPPIRHNSNRREVAHNIDIKAIHRFYTGAWINEKPYSIRLTIREYHDGRAELGEEAKAYALHIKEMRGTVTGQFSESPASHGLTTALGHAPLTKENISGISAPSPRCGQAPPTDIPLTMTKIAQSKRKSKPVPPQVPLKRLIESNLKAGEEALYLQRNVFDYSKTGTNSLETIFDRMGLRAEQRTALYKGDSIIVSGVRLHSAKTDIILTLKHGELVYRITTG